MSRNRCIFGLAWAILLVVLSFQPASAQGGVMSTPYRSDPPTYALHLVDGRTAIVWWDARTDPAQPRWICEVPAKRDGTEANRVVLKATGGNWRAALSEATALLGGLVADGE